MNCPSAEVWAAWLDGEVTLDLHQRLGQHELECARCAAEAKRLRALAAQLRGLVFAPPADGFAAELATKLDADRHRWRTPWRGFVAAASVAAVAFAIGIFSSDRTSYEGTFQSRGGSAQGSRVGFDVYVHEAGRRAVRLREGQTLSVLAGYSFVVFNRSKQPQHLMLFAVDAGAEVHWFYPAYLDPRVDPQSIRLGVTPEVQELPEGITPERPAHGRLRFVGVFSRAALSVREVEALLVRGGLAALSSVQREVEVHVLHAEVRASEPPR